ncbi:hypothetical protein [Rhizorhabdus dicambivorans]|uniref:Uncharacterized protein n=1 Tax=Rhizorhabdus dicambivorans TaxID=1850238 RepID=A0A2A4FZ52_9SPHN|nr:hypothetical protein [Rhizorhabdus dicambivorans]ATE66770.1 hypothetical protein CMV14_22095 [Rhizorhabdus dicambivorans]PCE43742.1 hypothetical protein COO09_02050 [Rhizorhabdus dicambivorans]
MYETRIQANGATARASAELLAPMQAMLDMLSGFADAAAPQSTANGGLSPCLAARYAAASPIARRRFDAVLREAETIGTTGLRLVMGRCDRADAATIAAARFLGNSLDAALRRLDHLLPAQAA